MSRSKPSKHRAQAKRSLAADNSTSAMQPKPVARKSQKSRAPLRDKGLLQNEAEDSALDSIVVSRSSQDAPEFPCWSPGATGPALPTFAIEAVASPGKVRRQTIVVDIKVEEDPDDGAMFFEEEDDVADDLEVEECLSSFTVDDDGDENVSVAETESASESMTLHGSGWLTPKEVDLGLY